MERDIELSLNDCQFDIKVENGDLALDNALVNRIIISLFTWSAPRADDIIPDGIEPGGYWGDGVESHPDDVPSTMGSRLWLLDGKLTDDTTKQAIAYATEALGWLKDADGIADFAVSAARRGTEQLDLLIEITMVNKTSMRLLLADILNWGK